MYSGCAERLYEGDTNYNAAFEPSGEDFLSPGLSEIDLMRCVSELDLKKDVYSDLRIDLYLGLQIHVMRSVSE